jgi:GNAT superfamily N-acetyltransferase
MVEMSALVDRWVQGWCDSRRMPRRRDGDGWLVDVAAGTRSREYVSATTSLPELHRLVTATTGPDVWLTLVGNPDAQSLETLSALDPVAGGECLMTAGIPDGPVPANVSIEEDGRVAHARIEVEGELAARGQAAVRGSDVVFDRIETMPEFRRRGLGRLVMTGLGAWAADNRATTGLLVASVSGRGLYESLGWSESAPIVTFRGRAAR